MASLYLSADLGGTRTISLKPITKRVAESVDPPISDAAGYFLIEQDGAETNVLARVDSDDAALRLGRLLGLS